MPSGTVHGGATRVITALFTTVSIIERNPDWMWVSAGALMGLFLGPDLDVDKSFDGERLIRNIKVIGRPLAFLYATYWWPYRKIMPHRSKASHFPVISTIGRWLYVLSMNWGIAFALGHDITVYYSLYKRELVLLFFGNFWADFAHWSMDAGTPQGVD